MCVSVGVRACGFMFACVVCVCVCVGGCGCACVCMCVYACVRVCVDTMRGLCVAGPHLVKCLDGPGAEPAPRADTSLTHARHLILLLPTRLRVTRASSGRQGMMNACMRALWSSTVKKNHPHTHLGKHPFTNTHSHQSKPTFTHCHSAPPICPACSTLVPFVTTDRCIEGNTPAHVRSVASQWCTHL
jgi:hypothetical protein